MNLENQPPPKTSPAERSPCTCSLEVADLQAIPLKGEHEQPRAEPALDELPPPVQGAAAGRGSHFREHARKYILIWLTLLVALFVSLGIGAMSGSLPGLVSAIFAIAFFKAFLVVAYFMHLATEATFIKVLAVGTACVLLSLYIGVFPDMVPAYGALNVTRGEAKAAEEPLRPGEASAGLKVYQRLCQACHQPNGSGMIGETRLAANFREPKRLQKTDQELLTSIRDGIKGEIGQMPAWEAVTSEQDRRDVLAYLRATFGAK